MAERPVWPQELLQLVWFDNHFRRPFRLVLVPLHRDEAPQVVAERSDDAYDHDDDDDDYDREAATDDDDDGHDERVHGDRETAG